jgi:O-succinylbenzoate synthase
MKILRPRSLNGLIMVGFGFVALPPLIAVIWALFSLDRVAEQSEQLVATGVSAAENNRRLEEQMSSLERVARQYQVLQNPDSLQLMAPQAQPHWPHLSAPAHATSSRHCRTRPSTRNNSTPLSNNSHLCGSALRA